MCGRYATTRSDADLSLLFDAVTVTEGLGANWNVAPTDPVPVIRVSRRHDARVVDTARWGLVPPWATDLRGGARMINARAETVATSPAFAPSFARRRCLIPADGWYEWAALSPAEGGGGVVGRAASSPVKGGGGVVGRAALSPAEGGGGVVGRGVRAGKQRQAYYLTPVDGSTLAFAGLWSVWGPESVLTCSVLTTAALGGLARVHDRMPLIMARERWADWLAGGGAADHLLRPPSPGALDAIEIRAVRPDVGNVRNNGPELVTPPEPEPEPAPAPAPAPTLF